MKTIGTVLIIILSGLFIYKPKYQEKKIIEKKDIVAPELLQCDEYRQKIIQNINQYHEQNELQGISK